MRRPARDNPASARGITRRALVLGGAQAGMAGLLVYRMHSLQVDQADDFRLLAEENRINIRLLPPARGMIFDRNGVTLADNEQNYRVVMVREDLGDLDEALRRLAMIVPISPEDLARAKQDLERHSPFVPVTVAERLTWEEIGRVAINAPALPGINPEVGLSRRYPLGADFAHIVGYVGPVSDYDLNRIDDQDPLLQIPRFQIGKTGVEDKFERTLRGHAGSKQVEVNAAGRAMRELSRDVGEPGADIQLTIDARLQSYTEARLEGESAAAVVIDVETGDLRAIGNAPSFDPNLFVRGISVADWAALNEDIRRPLAAKAVQGTYPPGSTFKMMTAIAALEAGVLDPEETVRCQGYVEVSGTRFHCWKAGGHGNVTLHESLKQSCDVFYYEVSQRVGIDNIARVARDFGLGTRFDVPMSAIAAGLAPDRAWKQEVRGEDWRIGDTINASIGQGYVLASPLQLAVMTARLATGRAVTPRLVRAIDGAEQPRTGGEPLPYNENFLRRIRQAMFDVSNHQRGTAYGSRIATEEFRMAGKTGTSQVRRITAEEREQGITRNEDLPWERRDHALFVCFAPLEAPRYAVAVVVEHGGGGSTNAAPIARDIMLQALYDGPPPLTAYPSNLRPQIEIQQQRIRDRVPPGSTSSSRA